MTMTTIEDDLRSDAFVRDPYPVYQRLRDEAPVYFSEAWNGFLVSRYDDAKAVLQQPTTFSSAERVRPRLHALPEELWQVMHRIYGGFSGFFWSDPPEYTAHRDQMGRAFRPRLKGIEARIEALVDDLLDAAVPRGAMDAIADLAHPLPATVVFEILGIPQDGREQFRRWSEGLIQLANLPTVESATTAMTSMDEASRWVRELLEERHRDPQDDMLSELAAELPLDRFTDQELRTAVVTLIQLLLAGHETTTSVIGTGLFELLRRPEARRLVEEEDDAAAPTAVEELLRYHSPLQLITRRAAADVELAGVAIGRDQLVMVLLGSANRDEAQFPAADRLDVRRRPNRHLAFGFNIHFCLGAPLGRAEAQIALRSALRRLPGLALVDEAPRWRRNAQFRGLEELPLTFDPTRARGRAG